MSDPYKCVGSVRGSCGHEHRTMGAAVKCLDRDRAGCKSLGGGSYSGIVASIGWTARR